MEGSWGRVMRLGWRLTLTSTCEVSSGRPEVQASGTETCDCREEIEGFWTGARTMETGDKDDQVLAESLELWRTEMTSADPAEAGTETTCRISGTKVSCLERRSS